jgi:hypothetical protein
LVTDDHQRLHPSAVLPLADRQASPEDGTS